MKNAHTGMLMMVSTALMALEAQAVCSPNMPLTRPDSRYEAVTGANPAGSEVRDKVTGLVWQRCVLGMLWDGSNCTGTPSQLTWPEALDIPRTATPSAAATGAAARWRVPNQPELFSLAERACYRPAINNRWFPDMPNVNSWTWSSSPDANDIDYAWEVNTQFGGSFTDPKDHRLYVRLVRAGK